MWSINNYTIPVEFAWRWQQASAPDTPPQVENAVTVFPPPPPAEEKPPKENTKVLTDDSAGSPTDGGKDDEEDNQDGEEKKHRKRRPPPPPEGGERRLRRLLMTASRRLQQAEGATSATQWWPSQEIPMPLNAGMRQAEPGVGLLACLPLVISVCGALNMPLSFATTGAQMACMCSLMLRPRQCSSQQCRRTWQMPRRKALCAPT